MGRLAQGLSQATIKLSGCHPLQDYWGRTSLSLPIIGWGLHSDNGCWPVASLGVFPCHVGFFTEGSQNGSGLDLHLEAGKSQREGAANERETFITKSWRLCFVPLSETHCSEGRAPAGGGDTSL